MYPSIIQDNGDTFESEIYAHPERKSGSYLWITAVPLYHTTGALLGVIESIRNRTDRRVADEIEFEQKAEELLQGKNEELATAFEELTATEEELRATYEIHLQTELELRKSEEKFRSLVEYAFEPILIVDLQGTIIFGNQALVDLVDLHQVEDLLGRNVMEFIAPESQQKVIEDFMQVTEGIDGFISEYQAVTAKGNKIFVESVGKQITFEDKLVDLLSIHDITFRKNVEQELLRQNDAINCAYHELTITEEDIRHNYDEIIIKEQKIRESEERFRAIFSMVPDPIILTRIIDGKIIDCNHAVVDLIGIPYEAILGRSTIDFQIWKSQVERENFLQDIITKGNLDKRELLWKKSDGTILNLIYSSRMIEVNGEKIFLSVGFDLTDLKKTERLLKESEEMFRNPVEHSPVGVFLFQNGYFRYANARLASIFGYSREQLVNISIESIISSSDLPLIKNILFCNDGSGPLEQYLSFQGVRSDSTFLELEIYTSGMQYQGQPAMYGTIIDITDRKRIEEARHQSERMYRLITENMKDVVWILDIDTWAFRYVSPSVKRLRGYTADEVLARPFSDAITPQVFAYLKEAFPKSRDAFLANPVKKEYAIAQFEQPCRDGSLVMTEVVTNFFFNEETGNIEILGVSRDISDRNKAEIEIEKKTLELYRKNEELCAANEELIAIEEERRRAYEHLSYKQQLLSEQEVSLKNAQAIAHLGNWEWNMHDDQFFASDEFCRIFGLTSSQGTPTHHDLCTYINSSYRDLFTVSMKALYLSGTPFTQECMITRSDGTERFVRCQGEIIFNQKGTFDHLTLIVLDITEQNRMERELIDAYKEKEILLREIHHRVKNNMQIISSLLSMQSRSIQDPIIKDIFKETQTRVRSLSLVHELLYLSDSLNHINYRKYLQRLVNYLLDSYNISRGEVTCTLPVHDVSLSIEKAVPCSLIVTELITNSCKYAFPDGKKGEIRIDFQYYPDSTEYVLRYSDNGLGVPREPGGDQGVGFGSTLIQGLTRQLSGTIILEKGDPGVRYTLSFPSVP